MASCGTAGTGNWAAGPAMDYWRLARCDPCRRLQQEKVCEDSDCFQEDSYEEYDFSDCPQLQGCVYHLFKSHCMHAFFHFHQHSEDLHAARCYFGVSRRLIIQR